MNIERCFSTVRSVRESIDSADEAVAEVARWIDQNVVGDDVRSRQRPPDLERSLKVLHDALCFCDATVAEMDNDLNRIFLRILGGRRLTREEFHLTMALDPKILNFTNKSTGLSDFDDYEVFEHFCL